ncbi:MAG: AI-2E family transporter [Acidaminobacteraceae bacterium]
MNITDDNFKKKLLLGSFAAIIWAVIMLIMIDENLRNYVLKMITPITTAFAIAYLLDPMVRFVTNKFRISRGKSILITILTILLLVVLAGSIAVPSLIKSLSSLNHTITENSGSLIKQIENISFLKTETLNEIFDYVIKSIGSIATQISQLITTSLEGILTSAIAFTSSVVGFLMSFAIAIYMLASKSDLLARIKRMNYAFFPQNIADYNYVAISDANKVFSGFFIGKLIDSLIIGILAFAAAAIFKVPNPMLIGVIIGITNMVPYFGPIIGAVPCFIITLMLNPSKALILLVIILVLQQLDGLVIGPKILGDTVGVDAFWIIAAVTIGGAGFGILGMLLGVPVIVIIKNMIETSVERKLALKGMETLELDRIQDLKNKNRKVKK